MIFYCELSIFRRKGGVGVGLEGEGLLVWEDGEAGHQEPEHENDPGVHAAPRGEGSLCVRGTAACFVDGECGGEGPGRGREGQGVYYILGTNGSYNKD